MKKMLMIVVMVVAAMTLHAEEVMTRAEQRVARYELDGKENYLIFSASTGFDFHNQLLISSEIEYSRQIANNWFWGATFQGNLGLGKMIRYDWDGTGLDPYRNSVHQNIYTLSGVLYYRMPIIKGRLFLRPGIGIGLGYHQMQNHIDNDPALSDKLLPYFNAELSWLLRVSKSVELKFAPTIIGAPQSFAISPVKLGAPTDILPSHIEAGFSLGVATRF